MQRPELTSTGAYIAWHARNAPETTAIVENGSHISYRRMASDLLRCIRALEGFGIRHGMLVGIQTTERYPHLLLMLACELAGATATSLTRGDLADDDGIIRYCDVILAEAAPAVDRGPSTIAIPADLLACAAVSPLTEDELAPLERRVAPDQIVRIVRTSGTTGRPKAMPMSHAAQQLRAVRSLGGLASGMPPKPRYLCLYGLGVGSIYVRTLAVLQHGGTVWFGAMEQARALLAAGIVDHASFALGDIQRIIRDAAPPPPAGHVLHLMVFGAAVSHRLRRQIAERLNARISNRYSSNETNAIAMLDDNNVGTLVAGAEARIVDASGRDLPLGEPGMIRVRTETMVHGYFNDAAMTQAAFIDGWYQTNDLGIMPHPGQLIVLGRADDMLNIGGVKIAPLPIETQVRLIDGVSDAVIMSAAGGNDESTLLVAVEVDGQTPPDGLERHIGTILQQLVSTFQVMALPWFPRTGSGKVRRHEIAAAFRQRQARDRIAAD